MNLRQAVEHNLGLKALSLFLAVIIWLFVAAGREKETSISVPVLVENVPAGLVVDAKPPSAVDVRIKGPMILLLESRVERPALILDLKGSREGTTAFPALEALISLPEGVRVTRVTPATIEVRLARAGIPGKGK